MASPESKYLGKIPATLKSPITRGRGIKKCTCKQVQCYPLMQNSPDTLNNGVHALYITVPFVAVA